MKCLYERKLFLQDYLREQLHNTGPLLNVRTFSGLFGSAMDDNNNNNNTNNNNNNNVY